jgi:hypothetical protein
LPGVSAPPPFGASQRTILVRLDPGKLRAYNMSPDEVVRALAAGNTVSPSGNVRIGEPVDSVVGNIKDLSNIPIPSQGTQTIFIRDVGSVEHGADIQIGYALVDGRRTVYIPARRGPSRACSSKALSTAAGKVQMQMPRAPLMLEAKISLGEVTGRIDDLRLRCAPASSLAFAAQADRLTSARALSTPGGTPRAKRSFDLPCERRSDRLSNLRTGTARRPAQASLGCCRPDDLALRSPASGGRCSPI